MSSPQVRLLIATLVLLCLVAPASLLAQPGRGQALLGPAPAAGPGGDRGPNPIRPHRSRIATARLQALADEGGPGPEQLLLNLFDDVQLPARRTSSDRGPDGRLLWRGRLEDGDGQVTIAARGAMVAATAFASGRVFEIRSLGDGTHDVSELDPSAFPTDDPPLQSLDDPSGTPADAGSPSSADGADVIDVLVVYTPAARTRAGGVTGIRNLIDLSVANANTAYANSLVDAQLRLVGTAEVAYTESNDISTDLTRLRSNGDGHLDAVHALRDQYGADLVSLIGTNYSGACGIGYLLGSPSSASPSYGFNVVRDSCAAGNLSFAHEIGHNEGLHHDPPNANGSASYPYAYGYQDPGGAFRTVMSYGGATRVMHLSSASVTYNGRPTGVANAQDNARALGNTAGIVAGFLAPAGGVPCSYTVTPTSLAFGSGGGTMSISLSTTAACEWSASSSAGWAVLGRSSGTGSATIAVTVAANTGGQRSTTLNLAGRSVAVTQAAPSCSYSVSPTSLTFPNTGNTTSVSVTTSAGCSWTATSGASWVTLSRASGNGSGTVSVTTDANAGGARSTSLSIAGRTVSVSQAAAPCAFDVSPTTLTFSASGGTRTVTLETGASCSWAILGGASWLMVSQRFGSGQTSITLTATANPGAARSTTVSAAGTVVTVNQNATPPPAAPRNLRVVN